MRFLLAAATLLAAAIAGCNARETGPAAPAPPPSGAPIAPAAVRPAAVVYTTTTLGIHAVIAALEDASAPPVELSTAGVDTSFGGALPEHRALLAEHAADGSIAAFFAIGADGAGRAAMGSPAAGRYKSVARVEASGDVVVIEAARAGAPSSDVVALRPGAAPALLAEGATLTLVAAGRVAFVTGGDLRSVALDGSGSIALGGGDGHDSVAEARGDRILLTVHAGVSGDVRLVGIDGSGAALAGDPAADEVAFGVARSERIVFVRKGKGGAVVVSTALDGKGEAVLTTPDLDAKPHAISDDGDVVFASAAGALFAMSAKGGATRSLDPAAGTALKVSSIARGRVFYAGSGPHWPALRSAALDGSGVTVLCDHKPWVPFFNGLSSAASDERVVFYRGLSGQLEGGRVYSVKLDGTDLRPVGETIDEGLGKAPSSALTDQDFEAITPSGRVIFEAEFEGSNESRLLSATAVEVSARTLTGLRAAKFAGLVP